MYDPYDALYVSNPVIEQLTRAYIDEIMPDIVHVTACDYVTMAVVTAAKNAHVPVVLTLTGKWHVCPVATLLRSDGDLCRGRQPGMTCLRCMFGETRTYRALRAVPEDARRMLLARLSPWTRLYRRNGSLDFIEAVERRNAQFPVLLAKVDYIISPSQCHREVFSRCGTIPMDRIVYSPHGHQVARASRGSEKTPCDGLRFGFTGRVFSHKGVDVLITAFNQLQAQRAAYLHVFGEVDATSSYGQRILALVRGNPSILLRGAFSPAEIGRVLADIDVLVVPSLCVENAPVTIAEAFAAQTPVIGSDVCGIAEHIEHGVNGLLFRRGDAADLARQMQAVINKPELVVQFAARIPPVRTAEDETAALLSVYGQLVGRDRQPVVKEMISGRGSDDSC